MSRDHSFEEKGEPKRIRTEVPLLTILTPYRWAKQAHNGMLVMDLCIYGSMILVMDLCIYGSMILVMDLCTYGSMILVMDLCIYGSMILVILPAVRVTGYSNNVHTPTCLRPKEVGMG